MENINKKTRTNKKAATATTRKSPGQICVSLAEKQRNNTKRVLGPQGLKAMEIGAKQYDKEAKKGPLDLKTRALKMNL